MMGVDYKTKKDLKAAIGQRLRITPSAFGPEYQENGTFCVVGPSPYVRKWFAEVTIEKGIIKKVE